MVPAGSETAMSALPGERLEIRLRAAIARVRKGVLPVAVKARSRPLPRALPLGDRGKCRQRLISESRAGVSRPIPTSPAFGRPSRALPRRSVSWKPVSRGPILTTVSATKCAEIRTFDIPTVIYTSTHTSSGDEQLAMTAGADRFLRSRLLRLSFSRRCRSFLR